MQSALQKTEELASQNESEIDATKISVDDLISQARGLWLNATSDVPGTRKQIRTVLYVRANQLAEKIVSATDRPDAAADIVSFADLVNAELSIVGDDRVYSLAAKAVATIEEWSMGPPPEALTEIAFELRQTIDRIEPQQP